TTTELPPLPEPVSSTPAAAEPAPVAAIRPPPTRPPIQPPPAAKSPAPPPISREVSPPRIETEPTRDGSMARITFVAPSAPAENKPEKPLPIGTGGSAFPRVPASSGPPVPPAAPQAAAPARIPFQMPSQTASPKIAAQTPAPPAAVQETPKVAPGPLEPAGKPMVVLPLRPILQSLPPMQVDGEVASVPAEA